MANVTINIATGGIETKVSTEFAAPDTIQQWTERWGEDSLLDLATRMLRTDIQNKGRERLKGGETVEQITAFVSSYNPNDKAERKPREVDPITSIDKLIATLSDPAVDAAIKQQIKAKLRALMS